METQDNEKQGLRCPWAPVNVAGSTWAVPLLLLAVDALCVAAYTWMGLGRMGHTICLSIIALSFLALVLWFIASLFFKQGWGSRGLRLLFTVLVGGVFLCNNGGPQYWHVPEGVGFKVPAGLSVEEDAPDIVKRLAGTTSEDWTDREHPARPEEASPLPPKNLEFLATEHPDLLRELWMRAKILTKQEYTRCEDFDCPHMGTGYRCTIKLAGTGTAPPTNFREGAFDDSPGTTVRTVEQLENGWSIQSLVKEVSFGNAGKADGERLQGFTVQQYDERFAELAQHPAMETVDTLIPLPQAPRLNLAESFQPGIYSLTLWLPKDARRDGHYEIRAFEYTTGTELSLDRDSTLKPESAYELANALVLMNPDFMVHTGDWGQYYGSRWQVWFVPAQGEKELVCEQLFLMQGWMR